MKNNDKKNNGKLPTQITALIIDDEDAVREPIVEYLCLKGVDADGAPDGETAIQALKKKTYNLCVVDLLMPGMSGEEFIAQASNKYPSMNFIVVTGQGIPFEDNFKKITNIPGVATALQKPFALEKLYDAIIKIFRE